MRTAVVRLLLDVNRQFYQTFAQSFSATRQRLQPGVRRVLEQIPAEANLLDLGCGNGELWQTLAQAGHQGSYVGLDFSPGLLDEARARQETHPQHASRVTFLQADLAETTWEEKAVRHAPEAGYDWVLAFAVLHHLPGAALRREVLAKVYGLLRPGGKFIHSVWQFLDSPRLRERIQPWEQVGLPAQDVEPGDFLMDWRHGGLGLRYVHYFTESELQGLATETGFVVSETFRSDGEGGQLGLYQIWQKNGPP